MMSKQTAGVQLQVALDFINWDRAERAARAAVAGGATILEAGTPLIKSEGLDVVGRLRERFPGVAVGGARARQLEEMGVDEIGVHAAIDEQMSGEFDPFARLRLVRQAVSIP